MVIILPLALIALALGVYAVATAFRAFDAANQWQRESEHENEYWRPR